MPGWSTLLLYSLPVISHCVKDYEDLYTLWRSQKEKFTSLTDKYRHQKRILIYLTGITCRIDIPKPVFRYLTYWWPDSVMNLLAFVIVKMYSCDISFFYAKVNITLKYRFPLYWQRGKSKFESQLVLLYLVPVHSVKSFNLLTVTTGSARDCSFVNISKKAATHR